MQTGKTCHNSVANIDEIASLMSHQDSRTSDWVKRPAIDLAGMYKNKFDTRSLPDQDKLKHRHTELKEMQQQVKQLVGMKKDERKQSKSNPTTQGNRGRGRDEKPVQRTPDNPPSGMQTQGNKFGIAHLKSWAWFLKKILQV